jgi:hypothetical protein
MNYREKLNLRGILYRKPPHESPVTEPEGSKRKTKDPNGQDQKPVTYTYHSQNIFPYDPSNYSVVQIVDPLKFCIYSSSQATLRKV